MHHVLIADDDRAIRESLARALELKGYVVTVVVDGVEALTHARRAAYDALVLDVMMPGVDGLGVCRVLRADGNHTPVLMLTARVEPPTASWAWTPAPTTTCPSPSTSTSCWPDCAPCCVGRRRGPMAPTGPTSRCASAPCRSTRRRAARGGPTRN